jgi:hypothetical protein
MPLAVAAQNVGVGPCRVKTCGDMLEATARIAPSQPNEATARIAPRSLMVPMVKNKNLLVPSYVIWTRFEIVFGGSKRDSKRGSGSKGDSTPP